MHNDIRFYVRKLLPLGAYRSIGNLINLWSVVRTEGIAACLNLCRRDRKEVTLSLHSLSQPFRLKRVHDHVWVFIQSVFRGEYDRFLPKDPRWIIDAGAFIGDLSCYWATRFPEARIVALEPDAENARFAQENMARYGNRLTFLKKGLWSRPCKLKVRGAEMGAHVEETDGEVYDVEGIDVPTIIRQFGIERIDILKIDIEGAEREVFAGSLEWLPLVDRILLECHGKEIEEEIVKRLSQCGFKAYRYRSVISFVRQNPTKEHQ
jgi:FkbM family methyltransferase